MTAMVVPNPRPARMLLQAASFAGANALVSALGALSAAVLARRLAPTAYGNYSLAVALLTFSAMFFEFGIFLPAGREIARRPYLRHELIGASMMVFGFVGAAFVIATLALAPISSLLFNHQAGHALLLAAPLAWSFPLGFVIGQLAQGAGRLHVVSVTSVMSQLLFLAALGVAFAAGPLTVDTSVIARAVATALAGVAGVVWLRPHLRRTRLITAALLGQARRWGTQVYFGRLISIGTFNMDVLMLGALAPAREVGLYTLAASLSYVVALPAYGLANAAYPEFANGARISRRLLVISTVAALVVAVILWAVAGPFVRAVFGPGYVRAATLLVPLAAGQVIRGVTTLYNNYLAAVGAGRDLRRAAVVLAVSNLILNIGLIPLWGAMGAAVASLLALAANLIAHVAFYRRPATDRGTPS